MLFKKMIRDLRNNKSQFISIFIMIFLGVFIYTGVNSDYNGIKVSSEQFYQESKLADVWVYGNGFSEDDVKKVQERKEVSKVMRRSVLDTFVKGNKKKQIELYVLEDESISKMKVIKGKPYQNGADGIWIDQSYAKANHLKLNDKYTLEMNGITITKNIEGFVLHPEMVFRNTKESILPDYKNSGYAFVSKQHLNNQDQIPFTQLVIATKNPTKMERVISETLDKNNLTFIEKKNMESYATLNSEIIQHQAFGNVFPIIFLLIAVLTTMTTLSKMIVNQRLQIGILKALGFQNYQVTLHYLSHVIVIASIAAILGFLVGPLIIPAIIFPMMKSIYMLPSLYGVPLSSSVVMVIASITVCFVVAFLVCRKQLKEKPAQALRPAQIVYKKKIEKNRLYWKCLSFYTQWNIRDVYRNKIRSFIAILGVMGCIGLMVCALGLNNSMEHMTTRMFEQLQTYEMRIAINDQADVLKLSKEMEGSRILEGAIELKNDELKKAGSLSVQEDTRYLKLQDTNLNNIQLPKKGIALSYNMAKSFNLKENDFIYWRVMGNKNWTKSSIAAIIHTPASQGITMSIQEFEKSGNIFVPTGIVGNKANVKHMQGVTSIQYLKEDIAESMDIMMEGMNLMIMILILGALVLGVVVLYNIGTFSYIEKMRDMATLKVLGFSNKDVKKLLRQQNLWLTLTGILMGLPFGYVLIYSITSTIGENMDMLIMVSPITIFGCITFTIVVSSLVIMFVSKKVKEIDMVSALKSIE